MKEQVTIRQAIKLDAAPIHELHQRSVRQLCSEAYSKEIIEGWLANRTPQGYLPGIDRGEMYVAEIDGRVVGFGHAVPGEIAAIYVDPAFTRRGIAKQLLQHGMNMATAGDSKAVKIDSTLNARPFYESCGFRFVKEITLRRNNVDIPALELRREIP
jgi:GNAT superfamily N-acetyltransferase